jgi:hypothetical protein
LLVPGGAPGGGDYLPFFSGEPHDRPTGQPSDHMQPALLMNPNVLLESHQFTKDATVPQNL